jgi:uncharacterized coiled-coil protein SlyX
MPEWLLALVGSTLLSGAGLTWKRLSDVNDRVDQLEIRIAEDFATKADMNTAFDKVDQSLCRFENKLDALVMSELRTLREGFVQKVSEIEESSRPS